MAKESEFLQGYNQALSDNKDQLFTLEDMEWAFLRGAILNQRTHKGENFSFSKERTKLIQSLTKQEYDCELEMDRIPADRAPNGWDMFPKIANNSIKLIKILKK